MYTTLLTFEVLWKEVHEGMRLCVLWFQVKTLHEDKLVAALSRFVAEDLGEIFTQSPPAAIGDIYPDTTKCVFAYCWFTVRRCAGSGVA